MRKGKQSGLAGENYRLYKVWHGMLTRCNNPSYAAYHRYGGRGIKVCPDWVNFSVFYEWALENGYRDDLTIDRIDNDLGYSPRNCRWAGKKVQSRNRENNVLHEYKGQHKTLPEWAEISGISRYTLIARVTVMGWDMHRAMTEPANKKDKEITALGRTQKLSEWAKETGMPKDRIYLRLKRGWSPDRAVTEGANA